MAKQTIYKLYVELDDCSLIEPWFSSSHYFKNKKHYTAWYGAFYGRDDRMTPLRSVESPTV